MKPFLHVATLATRLSRAVAHRRPAWQALAGLLALGLGFWGWTLHAPPKDFTGWFNNLFRTIQLITLQFPTSMEAAMPWQLQVARLAVPLVAALATFNVLIGAITRPVRLAMMPRVRDHIIVCGAEQMTEGALRTLAEQGRRIVIVAPGFEAARRDALEALGLTLYEADPVQPATFPALNLKAASALFLTSRDDIANLDLAVLALAANSDRSADQAPLALGVLIEREDLATELDAALDQLARKARVRYHRLCPDRDGLRLDLSRMAPAFHKADAERASHVLVIGLTGQWPQTLMQTVTATQDFAGSPPALTLVLDDGECEAFNSFAEARPQMALVADILVVDRGAGLLPDHREAAKVMARGEPDLVLVLRPDADAVATALALRRPGCSLPVSSAPILVRRSAEDRLLGRLATAPGKDGAKPPLAGLAPFGGLIRPETIERILDRTGDDFAIALHAHYLGTTKTEGSTSQAALTAWDALPENLRDANRAAAEHARILMAAGGADPIAPPDPLPAEAPERMARIEHRRWMTDRIDRGWRFGETRDDIRRLHPSIRPFDELSNSEQQKDREAVLVLARLLRENGKPALDAVPTQRTGENP
ncbi:MAG: NAD-binding protein [Phreatobacter sp.]|nr:NAD-binding protein [Phreatobacter sp.]